jgi:hypothetical protein
MRALPPSQDDLRVGYHALVIARPGAAAGEGSPHMLMHVRVTVPTETGNEAMEAVA